MLPAVSYTHLDVYKRQVSRLPFEMLYPTGRYQDQEENKSIIRKYYHDADIIAGDYLYIKKHMPKELNGKTVITNTVTLDDVQTLKKRGVRTVSYTHLDVYKRQVLCL